MAKKLLFGSLIAASTLLILLAGCGGGNATTSAPPVSVTITITPVAMIGGATQTFTVTVSNDTSNAGVTWTASIGTITAAGVYTAPAIITTTSATITATSIADPTKSVSVTVPLTPISVTITITPVSMIGGATQTFTAAVAADGSNSGVTWTASTGTITTAGVYTAPAVITTGSATVTATSVKDPTKSASVTVPLTPISVGTISPASIGLSGGGSQAFTVAVTADGSSSGVTWSIGAGVGTLSSATKTGVTYTAPAVISGTSPVSVSLIATSVKDPTKSSVAAAITLTPISVTITTVPVAMLGGANQTFAATVTNDAANAGVTWTASTGTITTAGVYTAPAVITATSATITATSKTDTTKSASVTVPLTPIAISFTTVTTGVVLDSGQTLSLAAAVANDGSASGASFTASGAGTVAPPTSTGNSPATVLTATGTSASSVTVTATSIKDTTKSASTASITVNPALVITTAAGALAAATLNITYPGATISASGGTGTKTFAIASGALPTGLTLNASTGAISGTATGSGGISTFTVKVTDTATTPNTVTSGNYTITVTAAPLVWVTPTAETLTYTVGTAITPITLTTTGGTGSINFTLNSGLLPGGLSIVGGQLVGTPTATTVPAGNPVTFLATDSAATPVKAVSPIVTLISNPVPLVITTTALPTGTVGSAYNFTLSSTGGTGVVNWSMVPTPVDGISLATAGLLSGTPTATNASSVTITARDSDLDQQQSKQVTLALNVTNALTITSGTSFNAPDNNPFATTLTAAGGSGTGYTWSVTAGQASLTTYNLSLSSAGVLSGTPVAVGTASFTAQVKDSLGATATANITVTSYLALNLPAPNPGSLPSATTSQSYNGSITATGGVSPYSWTVNSIPLAGNGVPVALTGGLGLSVSNNTGSNVLSVSGTPTSTGTVTFTASIKDNTGAVAGPFTYTISVSTTSTVSGQITEINTCGSASSPPPIQVSINTTPVQNTTTDGGGNYSFSNVPNGTYTVTPSITGPSSVFFPATQSAVVSGSNVTANFSSTLGYTVSGTVSYGGASTGRVYVSLLPNGCTGSLSPGTSISAVGAYTIHGVPPGGYTLQGTMDNLGYGAQNASNPTGTNATVTVGSSNVTGANVSMSDPGTVTLTSVAQLQGISPMNTAALISYSPIQDSNGLEQATSYTLQWSTSSSFSPIAGSKTFPAIGDGSDVWVINGLSNGTAYYFRDYGTSGGTAVSPYSSTVGPVTINAPAVGNAVSGSVTFAGTATGPLYVGFFDQDTGSFYGQYIASPSSPQAYTVMVPTGSSYFFVGILDQNKDGIIDASDLDDIPKGSNPSSTSITGPTTGENLTLSSANSNASLSTQNLIVMNGAVSKETYTLNFTAQGVVKLPVAVTLVSGPNVLLPMDVGSCSFNNSCGGSGYNFSVPLSTTSPNVGDTYGLQITYSDGTSETLNATVGAVLTAFTTNLSPVTGVTTTTTPTFTWTYPASASSYTYSFSLNGPSGTIWQIPGDDSDSNGFPSSISPSIPWDVDPVSGDNSTPNVLTLTNGTVYSWQIQVQDSSGNQAVQNVIYEP